MLYPERNIIIILVHSLKLMMSREFQYGKDCIKPHGQFNLRTQKHDYIKINLFVRFSLEKIALSRIVNLIYAHKNTIT